MLRFPFFFLIVLLTMFTSCSQEQQSQQIVARVNDQVLTMETIRSQVDSSRTLSAVELQQYVHRWVTNELLYQEARQRGYDVSEEIQRKVADARKQLSVAELLEKEIYSLAESSIRPDEIASYYQAHSDEYVLKENMVQLSLAIFNQSSEANQFRASALGAAGWKNSIRSMLRIERFRTDETKGLLSFSDSLFFTQSSLYPPELWKVATALGMLEVSFPVRTSVGYVVMRSLGQFKKGAMTPLHYVEDEIRQRLTMELRQERYQTFVQTLRNKHTVQFMIPTTDSLAPGGE